MHSCWQLSLQRWYNSIVSKGCWRIIRLYDVIMAYVIVFMRHYDYEVIKSNYIVNDMFIYKYKYVIVRYEVHKDKILIGCYLDIN